MSEISAKLDCSQLDEAIEKANQLIALLQEVQKLIDSLSHKSFSIGSVAVSSPKIDSDNLVIKDDKLSEGICCV